MNKLEVLVLGVLSAVALALVGTFALLHPTDKIPTDLVLLAGVVVGALAGMVAPRVASSSQPAAPVQDLSHVVSALTDALGATLGTQSAAVVSPAAVSGLPTEANVALAVPDAPPVAGAAS